MKKILTLSLIFALIPLFSVRVHADSPVTSTPFSDAYMDIEIVRKARAGGVLDSEMAGYLSSKKNPIDKKAAVINALSWKCGGKDNAKRYIAYLEKIYRASPGNLDMNTLRGDEIFCLGYLTLMDDYFHPEKALPLLEKAGKKMKNSLTVSMILAIARAQDVMDVDTDRCEPWRITEKILQNKKLKCDLRPGAKKIIVNYMALYKEDCCEHATRIMVRRAEVSS